MKNVTLPIIKEGIPMTGAKTSIIIILFIWMIPLVLWSQLTNINDSLTLLSTNFSAPDEMIAEALRKSKEFEDTNSKKALQYAGLAYNLSENQKNTQGKIHSLLQLGNIYFLRSDYNEAMESALKSRELAINHEMEKETGNSLILIGRVYFELNSYDKSSEMFFESLKLFEKINDKAGIAESMGYVGNLFYTQKQYEKALDYLNKALELAKQIGNLKLISKQLNNIAVVYLDLKNYDTALVFLNESLIIEEQLGNTLSQGIKIFNIGFAELKQRKYDKAISSFNHALVLYSKLDNQLQMASCYLAFGQCYYEIDSIWKSVGNFSEALKKGMDNNYFMVIYRAANSLHGIYLEQNDTITAYRYSVIESIAKDSLTAAKNESMISKFELQYRYEKVEYEKQLAQQAKNTLYVIVFISLVSGLVILTLLFSRHRIKAKKIAIEKLSIEKELGFKNKELTIHLMSLIKNTEMMADVSKNLIEIGKGAKTAETKSALAKVGHKISHSSGDKIWKEFSTRFQEVHAGFYESLLQKYPDLSQNELKLCAFLRLNMSSKDISELTGQRIPTLENARYRLRKKLGISNSDVNLVTFLSQI